MRLSVVGTGYLGATHAAAMAELGHEVVGVDADPAKVATLSSGEVPFYEPGLADLISKHTGSGRLTFSDDIGAAADCDVHFVCVGTPQSRVSPAADLRQVDSAVAGLAKTMRPDSLVVGKSTVPVGTADRLRAELREATAGQARLVWNPEFLREGFAVEDTLRPDRIVVGVDDERDAQVLADIYRSQIAQGTPFLVTDYATAELVKVAANSFLATKISFINAMSEICDATGADVTTLAQAIGLDERIGRRFLRAGIGFGGGCLPKDIRAFMARADEIGVGESLAFLREVDRLNLQQRDSAVQVATELLENSLVGARIAVLGVAFKPDSDDVRDSPALSIAAALHLKGADVVVHDPRATANAQASYPTLTYVDSADAALRGADLTMLLTEWQTYRELDPERTGELVGRTAIFDGRNVLDGAAWRRAGWTYRGVGVR